MIALQFGARLQRGEIGAGAGLRISLAPADFTARDFRQMLFLLRLVAVLQQRRTEHPDAEAVERRAASERGHFLAQDFRLVARKPAAAVLARPFGHRPALGRHALHPLLLRIGLEGDAAAAPAGVVLADRRFAHFGRAVGLQPRASFCSEGFEIAHSANPLLIYGCGCGETLWLRYEKKCSGIR